MRAIDTIPKAKEDEDMSHFSVAVFSQTPGDVEALLAPFDEQVEAGSPYAESVSYTHLDVYKRQV